MVRVVYPLNNKSLVPRSGAHSEPQGAIQSFQIRSHSKSPDQGPIQNLRGPFRVSRSEAYSEPQGAIQRFQRGLFRTSGAIQSFQIRGPFRNSGGHSEFPDRWPIQNLRGHSEFPDQGPIQNLRGHSEFPDQGPIQNLRGHSEFPDRGLFRVSRPGAIQSPQIRGPSRVPD